MNLKQVVVEHKEWLRDLTKGKRMNLSNAYLSHADLSYTDLTYADLSYTDLNGANLRGTNLRGVSLRGASLGGADLCGANLRDADLCGANLRGAHLRGIDLCGANLCDASLGGADLCGANLRGAHLRGIDLHGADQKTMDFILLFTSILPSGDLIAYKATRDSIVTLRIPAKAGRVNYIGSRKCRAEFAEVIAIENKTDGSKMKIAGGLHDKNFMYAVGEMVKPDTYDPSPLNECSHGIHFFLTREEAADWNG